MLLVAAILLVVVFGVLKGTVALVAIACAACIEVSQPFFWLWYTRRGEAMVGAETLIGRLAEVTEECRPYGSVRVQGELWRARCSEGAGPGERVRIVGRDGLTLAVERASS